MKLSQDSNTSPGIIADSGEPVGRPELWKPTPGLNMVKHIHKLEKKQSSGDLQSRLKTRKLLGVGETDDGEVHRSKLSQILGHSEFLYTRFPKGLRFFQFILAFFFLVAGVLGVFCPNLLIQLTISNSNVSGNLLPVRMYGVVLMSLAIMVWGCFNSQDRDMIRWSFVSIILFFFIQFLVLCLDVYSRGSFLSTESLSLLVKFLLPAVLCLYYYQHLMMSGGRCSSYRSTGADHLTSTSLLAHGSLGNTSINRNNPAGPSSLSISNSDQSEVKKVV